MSIRIVVNAHKHYYCLNNTVINTGLRKVFDRYQRVQSLRIQGTKQGFILRKHYETIARHLGISRNTLSNWLNSFAKSGMAVKCKTGYRLIGIRSVLKRVLNCEESTVKDKVYYPYEKQNVLQNEDYDVKTILNVLKQSNKRFRYHHKAPINVQPKGQFQLDNVIDYAISYNKIAQSPAYAHLKDIHQRKNAICKAIKKAIKLGYLKVKQSSTFVYDYSSGIDPLIQQADPLVMGIGSAKQRTMV